MDGQTDRRINEKEILVSGNVCFAADIPKIRFPVRKKKQIAFFDTSLVIISWQSLPFQMAVTKKLKLGITSYTNLVIANPFPITFKYFNPHTLPSETFNHFFVCVFKQ